MAVITDEYMRDRLRQATPYCAVILKKAERFGGEGAGKIVWEHGRRNMSLQADGILPIVCPITDGGDLAGIAVFAVDREEARRIMEEDPGVQAGVFTYELHECRGFPGSTLPPR